MKSGPDEWMSHGHELVDGKGKIVMCEGRSLHAWEQHFLRGFEGAIERVS